MVTLEWSLERTAGVTLVEVVVDADRPCRVQIANRLDGPVWPPRRHGQPAEGWVDDTYTGRVPAEGRLTLGYATPAAPNEPPVELVGTEPADGDKEPVTEGESAVVPAVESSPEGVVRALGDPVVPRDSVPVPDDVSGGRDERAREADEVPTGPAGREGESDERPENSDEPPSVSRPAPAVDLGGPSETSTDLLVPGPVEQWFDDVERRLAADTGQGHGQVSPDALGAARTVDRRALTRVRERADALLAREDAGAR